MPVAGLHGKRKIGPPPGPMLDVQIARWDDSWCFRLDRYGFRLVKLGNQHILVKVQGALHTWCAIPFAMKLHKRYTRMTRAAPSTWQKCAGAGVVLWHTVPYLLSSP